MILYVEHETDTAHRLSCHKGKCKNLHGHRYKFVLGFEVKGTIEDEESFQDFYNLKTRVRELLDATFDHATVLKVCTNNIRLIDWLQTEGLKVCKTDYEPTVEFMVEMAKEMFPDTVEVTIYETPTNYCTWRKGDSTWSTDIQ